MSKEKKLSSIYLEDLVIIESSVPGYIKIGILTDSKFESDEQGIEVRLMKTDILIKLIKDYLFIVEEERKEWWEFIEILIKEKKLKEEDIINSIEEIVPGAIDKDKFEAYLKIIKEE